jgi:hypothetical protein
MAAVLVFQALIRGSVSLLTGFQGVSVLVKDGRQARKSLEEEAVYLMRSASCIY